MVERKRRTRIQWTLEEQTKLVSRAARLRRERTDTTALGLLRKAMNDTLPPHRRRKISVAKQVKWFEPAMIAEERRIVDAERRALTKEVKVGRRREPAEDILAVNAEIRDLVKLKFA